MSKYDGVKDKKQAVKKLFKSGRAQYIISWALAFTLERFKSVGDEGDVHRAESNIDDMELLLNELFPIAKNFRGLGLKVFKAYPTKGDSPGFLTLVKGEKDPPKTKMADLHQALWLTDSGNWILETPMDPEFDPQELTPKQARKWLLSTGPANAKLAKKYFPEGGE